MIFKILPLEERIVLDGAFHASVNYAPAGGGTVTFDPRVDTGMGADTGTVNYNGAAGYIGTSPSSFSPTSVTYNYSNLPADFTGYNLAGFTGNLTRNADNVPVGEIGAIIINIGDPAEQLAATNGIKEDSTIYWSQNSFWSSPDLTTSVSSTISTPAGPANQGQLGANYSGFISLNYDVNGSLIVTDHVNILPVADGIAGFSMNIGQGIVGTPQAITFGGTKIDTSTDLSNGGLESFTLSLNFTEAVQLNKGVSSNGGLNWTIQFNDLSELSGLTVTASSTNLIQGAIRLQTVDRALGFDDPAIAGGAPLLESTNIIDRYIDFSFRAQQADTPATVGTSGIISTEDFNAAGGYRATTLLSFSDAQGINDIQFSYDRGSVESVSRVNSTLFSVTYTVEPNYAGKSFLSAHVIDNSGNTTDLVIPVYQRAVADGVQLNNLNISANVIQPGQSIGINLDGLQLDTSADVVQGGQESHTLNLTFDSAVNLNMGTSSDGGLTWNVSFLNLSELAGLAFTSSAVGSHSFSANVTSVDRSIYRDLSGEFLYTSPAITSNTLSSSYIVNSPTIFFNGISGLVFIGAQEGYSNGLEINVTDADGIANVSIQNGANYQGGAGVLNANGTAYFAPLVFEPNFSGSDTLTFVATDNLGFTTTATYVIRIAPVADGVQLNSLNVAPSTNPGQPIAINLTGIQLDTSSDLNSGGLESHTLKLVFDAPVSVNLGSSSDGGVTWSIPFLNFSDLAGLAFTSNIAGNHNFTAFVISTDSANSSGANGTLQISSPINSNSLAVNFNINSDASVAGPALTVLEDGSNNAILAINDAEGIANVQVISAPHLAASVSNAGGGNYQISLNANDPNFSGDTVINLRITDIYGNVTNVSRVVSINPVADGFNNLAASNGASALKGQALALNISGVAIDTSNSLAAGGVESHVLKLTFDAAVALNKGSSSDGGVTWLINFSNINELAGLALTSNLVGSHSYNAVITTTDSASVSAGASSNVKVSGALVGAFQIISPNLNPTISLDSCLPAIYIENDLLPTPLEILPNVVDPDSPDGRWDNAQLTVKIGNPEAGDKVSILSLLKVKVSGSNVLYNNVVVGSLAGSTDSALKITFNSNATTQVVEDVARQIVYKSSSDDPSVHIRQGVRDIQYQISDGDGGISNVAHKNLTVYGVNDAPQIAINDADKTLQAAKGQWLNIGAMNIFNVTDADASSNSLYKVSISVCNGLLDIDTTGLNVIFAQDPGTGRASLTFTGTLVDINIALDRIMYKSTVKGTDTLSISVIDLNTNNFLGGIQTDTDALKIKVA